MKEPTNSGIRQNQRRKQELALIIGVGTDLIEISRVQKLLMQPSGNKFVTRILTEDEQQLYADRKGRQVEFVAGRFAAKEAIVKAIGCGIGELVGFQDINIQPDYRGKPECILSYEARYRLAYSAEIQIHISITHSAIMASAFAVVEAK